LRPAVAGKRKSDAWPHSFAVADEGSYDLT
jgi:hypothetical protein